MVCGLYAACACKLPGVCVRPALCIDTCCHAPAAFIICRRTWAALGMPALLVSAWHNMSMFVGFAAVWPKSCFRQSDDELLLTSGMHFKQFTQVDPKSSCRAVHCWHSLHTMHHNIRCGCDQTCICPEVLSAAGQGAPTHNRCTAVLDHADTQGSCAHLEQTRYSALGDALADGGSYHRGLQESYSCL
jgi:hypothetical protein